MVLSEGESGSQCLRFCCLFVLWSQRQAERTRQRLKPCGRERQILRRPPPPPPAGPAGDGEPAQSSAWVEAGWRFFPQQRAAGRGPWGRRRKRRLAFLVQYCHQEEKVLPIPRALHPPFLARGDKGVNEVWSQGTVSLGGQELRQALFGGGKRGQAAEGVETGPGSGSGTWWPPCPMSGRD